MKIGIYQTYWGPVGGGQRYIAVVAEYLARKHDVEIVHHCDGFQPDNVEEPMQVNLSRVGFRYVPPIDRPNWTTNRPKARLELERNLGRELSEPYDLFIDSSDIPPFFNHAKRGVLLTHFPLVSFHEYHGRAGNDWQSTSLPKRWLKGLFHRSEWKQRFASYDHYIVNSEFTQHWIKQLWGIEASVVFPPLRNGLSPGEKSPSILSIGAFRAEQHKKQTVMIDAFRSLCDQGLEGWNYVMMGASGPTDADQKYLHSLKELTRNYPIEILSNVSGDQLKTGLETSSILWHSMGYGVDENAEPRRMEHFGMVATEAMAAGCIPVVFNGGGLKEIVVDGECGFLWSTVDDMKQTTKRLTSDITLRLGMSSAAVQCSEKFARPAFEERLSNALCPVLTHDVPQHSSILS